MGKFWIIAIAIAIFLTITFLYWKIMRGYSKKEFGEKVFKQGPARLYFWQSAIFVSTAVTFLTLYILKWTNVLTF